MKKTTYSFADFHSYTVERNEIISLFDHIYSDMKSSAALEFFAIMITPTDSKGTSSSENPSQVIVSDSFSVINTVMNRYEYKGNCSVKVYCVDRCNKYFNMYTKYFDGCGYHRLAQCEKMDIEGFCGRALFDSAATVELHLI